MKNFILQNKLIFICIILLSIWYIDVWENANTCSRVLPIAAYLDQENFVLDNYKDKTIDISYINNHYYMDKAPLPTLIVLPFAIVAKHLNIIQQQDNSFYSSSLYLLGDIICGVIPFLLIIFYVIQSLVKHNKEKYILMGISSVFGSFLFVYSGTFFAHTLSAALILSAYLQYKKENFSATGLLLGAAFLSEYTTIWFLISWMLILFFKQKSFHKVSKLLFGFLLALLFIFWYNFHFTGNPFTMLYLYVADNFETIHKSTYGLSFPKLKSLFGLLFSNNRGLLLYAPVLLYGLFLVSVENKNAKLKQYAKYFIHPVILPFALILLFISSHTAWEGGWSYGPRHLYSPAVLLLFATISHKNFGSFNYIFWLFASYGLVCAFLAKLTVLYSIPELNENILPYLISKLKDGYNAGNAYTLYTQKSALTGFFLFIYLYLLLALLCIKKNYLLSNSKS